MVFFKNPPVEGTVTSMEQKTRVFWLIDVQEFHLKKYKNLPPYKKEDVRKPWRQGGRSFLKTEYKWMWNEIVRQRFLKNRISVLI